MQDFVPLLKKIGDHLGTDPLAELRDTCLARALEGTQPGRDAAEVLINQIKGSHTSAMSKALGAMLVDLDGETVDLACAELAHEWMFEHYWGNRIRNERAKFDATFEALKAMGATSRDNALSYGDADYSIWYVESGDHRIIASECHCSCADDNIHLWISWPFNFRSRTCSIDGNNDTRKYSEYATNWELGYGDGRDKGYCFDYSDFECRVKDALFAYFKVKWSLWYLGLARDATIDPDPRDLPRNNLTTA